MATQKEELRKRLDVNVSTKRLATFLEASVHLMQIMARACGHDHLSKFRKEDLTSWKRDMAELGCEIRWCCARRLESKPAT